MKKEILHGGAYIALTLTADEVAYVQNQNAIFGFGLEANSRDRYDMSHRPSAFVAGRIEEIVRSGNFPVEEVTGADGVIYQSPIPQQAV